ncbi:signal transduction histidine kinase [Pseudorhodoferax soli]|uniref:histidine kinase n=2 Tax=Pseudorhodoferax soli TaxID=545864 RepID=A0A368XT59_9BURK|nr:signal transduction histidine kinase [Pseudorhodoferax soli]
MPAAAVRADTEAQELTERRFQLMVVQVLAVRWSYFFMTAVVAAVGWQAVAPPWVLAWLAGAVLVFELRARWLARQATLVLVPAQAKVRGALLWNVALGLAYGLSALFMPSLGLTLSAVLTTIVVSAAAGAVAISGPLLQVYLAYTLSIMLPFALVWAANGTWLGTGLALLMAMFVSVQYRFARKVNETFTESFVIRRVNEQLVAELTVARDQANAANVAKTRFLAAASHDLRQPLHALSLQSSALLLDPRADDTPQIAAAIAGSIQDVAALLDSLLDISKLDAGTLRADRRPIQLSRMLEALGRSFLPLVRSKGLRFELQVIPGVVAVTDPMLLERILRNLVDNAIKFTPAGTIRMTLQVVHEELELVVSDTGIGIAPHLQAKVFDEFYQVDRHAQGHTQGLGLGLSIISRLALLLGIAVTLSSEADAGTTIRLRLPMERSDVPRPAPEAAPPSPGPGLRGLRILVLDDEPAVREGMSNLLRRLGCEVACGADTDEALACARTFGPRIVMADYRLRDDANGIDAIGRLRKQHPGLLSLLISGDTAPDRLREAADSGLQLLHKPVSLEQLKQALADLLDN